MKNTVLECETLHEVKELLNHKDSYARLGAYRNLGFTQEALNDSSWHIRLEAYKALGFTQDALSDEDIAIRFEAEKYFHVQKLKEKDEEFTIRTEKVNDELLQEMESILNRNSALLEIYPTQEQPKSNVDFSLLRQYSNEHDYASLNDLGVVTVSCDRQMSWEHLAEYEGYVGWFYQSDFTELTKQLIGE